MSDNRVRLQNPRDFTVQIRRSPGGQIIGTGIVVSADGKIVTCAHVVEAALGVHPRKAGDREVIVHFPQVRRPEDKQRRARVAACFPKHDDDVVLLQLTDGPPPLGPEQIAVLGAAEPEPGRKFAAFGYRRLKNYQGLPAHGVIVGQCERPSDLALQADPLMLTSQNIDSGMSGSAVLDTERNLVVGVVAETRDSRKEQKDRDTAIAVDAAVLRLPPFNIPVRDEPLPRRPAPEPRTDVAAARAAVALKERISWHDAPAPLEEWVGREKLLEALSDDWVDPKLRVTGLIGFGGEGKSSLARRWVDEVLQSDSEPKPDGVFWWGFYQRPNVDEFFEAALGYMSGGKIDPREYPSSSAKAHLIAGMLGAGRYLFVLDGLEVMQHQEGDEYGLIRNNDLRQFLGYFASPAHGSHCLATSRAPLLDLMPYTTCIGRDVERLSPGEGRELLRKLGVKGPDGELDKVVADWDGHALTLGLLGTYLAQQYDGDIAHLADLPPPTADEPRYARVHRVLRRYDEHLNDAERAFLTLFSAFRTPVDEVAFEKVFRTKTDASAINAPIAELDDSAFSAMIERLLKYRILRRNPEAGGYTAHPLVRAYYHAALTAADSRDVRGLHARIKDHYLAVAGRTPRHPTLDDLRPLIEVVHHACRAGAYDEAHEIRFARIEQGGRFVITHELGAYQIDFELTSDFFPAGGTSRDPALSDPKGRGWVLNEVGFCLMSLGHLSEAAPLIARANAIAVDMEDWHNAGVGYHNLSELHTHLGALRQAAEAGGEALSMAKRARNKLDARDSLAWQAWVAHLRGRHDTASAEFRHAEELERRIWPHKRHLYTSRGVWHAEHLRRTADAAFARRVTDANLGICERNRLPYDLSHCHRILGDLDASIGRHESAREHYSEALRIARSITRRDVLIEALLGRGRWFARHMKDAEAAFSELDEALGYAVESGYRIYEADIRNALAWAYIAAGDKSKARAEAERARQMSEDMGYHWGKLDANEVLAALNQRA